MTSRPLILLIFANDRTAYLESVTQERQQLLDLLEPWEERFGFQVKSIDYSTADGVIEALNTHHERLVMLHFAGHSKTDILHLDTGRAHANGLAAKLGNCPNLKLVFLNGCNNASLVRAIAEAGIPSVVGTSQRIADKLAADFSQSFFNALVAQGKNVAEAFRQAKSDVETVTGKGYRSLDLQAPLEEWYEWAWFMESQQPTWKLADAFHPCNRLPALKRGELPAKPFKNLYYYTDADAEIFFGRCQAILDVLTLLDETSEPLLLLHGGTGVGKSSFLQAGLIPRLKAPARQQIVHYKRCSKLDQDQDFLLQLFGSNDPAVIYDKLDTPASTGLPAVWIIDQMEELFLFHERTQDAKAQVSLKLIVLLTALHEIFYRSDDLQRPNAKLIFALRKEWFSDLHDACRVYGLKQSDYLLKPLDRFAVIEVVEALSENNYLRQHYHLCIVNPLDGRLAQQIADDLLADQHSNIAPTLQIILSRLWERVEIYQERIWNEPLYLDEKRKGLLLRDYLEHQLQDIANKESWGKEAKNNGLLLDVLYAHTNEWGTADTINTSKYDELYSHVGYHIELRDALKKHHLLIEPQGEELYFIVNQTRLAHDSLAMLVKVEYEKSNVAGIKARRILNFKIKSGKVYGLLSKNEYRQVKTGMVWTRRLNREEEELISKSGRVIVRNSLLKVAMISIFLFCASVYLLIFYFNNDLLLRTVNDEVEMLSLYMIKGEIKYEDNLIIDMIQTMILKVDALKPNSGSIDYIYQKVLLCKLYNEGLFYILSFNENCNDACQKTTIDYYLKSINNANEVIYHFDAGLAVKEENELSFYKNALIEKIRASIMYSCIIRSEEIQDKNELMSIMDKLNVDDVRKINLCESTCFSEKFLRLIGRDKL